MFRQVSLPRFRNETGSLLFSLLLHLNLSRLEDDKQEFHIEPETSDLSDNANNSCVTHFFGLQ